MFAISAMKVKNSGSEPFKTFVQYVSVVHCGHGGCRNRSGAFFLLRYTPTIYEKFNA